MGPRASTERKEDQREVRGKMTLTVEYSEMTAKIVEHVCVCVSHNHEYRSYDHFSTIVSSCPTEQVLSFIPI